MRLLYTRCLKSCLIISSIFPGGTPDTSYLQNGSAPRFGRCGREGGDGQRESSHDGKHPTIRLCSFLYTFTNLVANPTDSIVLCSSIALTSKSLKECAMYAMLRHPIEMPTPTPRVPKVRTSDKTSEETSHEVRWRQTCSQCSYSWKRTRSISLRPVFLVPVLRTIPRSCTRKRRARRPYWDVHHPERGN
jgi:hypothetical protein